ncbi:hypothetical protein GE061_017263 [Apolygus lucorum]|uniref:Uncharacterized protein n=1 Tax=Apolygus lucorum TaxID=248454 RepID=A0A6A4J4Z8_APOLU|nr:hypothetical protein GE061_017263 [Apolygus lucorum]
MYRLGKYVKHVEGRGNRLASGREVGGACHIFSGGAGESAFRFINAFEADAALFGWTDAQRLGAFEDTLVCEPRRWFREGVFWRWKSLRKAFLLRWGWLDADPGDIVYSDTESDDSTSDANVAVAIGHNTEGYGGVSDVGSSSEGDSTDDGMISMTNLFDSVVTTRGREERGRRDEGISNLKDFISTLD